MLGGVRWRRVHISNEFSAVRMRGQKSMYVLNTNNYNTPILTFFVGFYASFNNASGNQIKKTLLLSYNFLLILLHLILLIILYFTSSTRWLEEFSRSLSHQNYTFCTQKILLVSLRHPRSLGFQLCMPIFHIHLCTVGQFVFTWPKIWNCPQGQTKPNKIFIFINFNPG